MNSPIAWPPPQVHIKPHCAFRVSVLPYSLLYVSNGASVKN